MLGTYGCSNRSLNRQVNISEHFQLCKKPRAALHQPCGQELDSPSPAADSDQHIVGADCKAVPWASGACKQRAALLLYSVKITVQSGMITKNAIMGFHSVSRGQ